PRMPHESNESGLKGRSAGRPLRRVSDGGAMAAQLYPGHPPAAAQRQAPADPDGPSLPMLRVRGRSVMALVIAPEPPFANWFAALDQQMRRSAGFFADRPVVVDLGAVFESVGRDAIPVALDGIE